MKADQPVRSSHRFLVIFSPMPPKQNGIATYVAEQLPYHCRDYSVTVVIDNADPAPTGLPNSVEVLRLEEYFSRYGEFGAHRHLYHIGNNVDHGYLLPVLYDRPGAVVIHDLGLHHLIDTQTLVQENFEGYAWALWQQYGRAGKRLGDQFLRYGWKGQHMPQELRLNGAVINAAEQVIVHSRYSAHRIEAQHPGKTVSVIPHHLSPSINQYNRARRSEAREWLGLPQDRPVLTSLGFITRPKQIESILLSLARLKSRGQRFFYVLAGQYRPDEYDVKADIARFGLEGDVLITGYLDEDSFFRHLVATDMVLNLRYPSGGETSGTLTRALGMGRCCIVVDIGPFTEIPADCAVKLEWGEDFEQRLEQAMERLLSDPMERAGYETRCRDWVSRTQAIQLTTRTYHQVIDSLVPLPDAGTLLMKTPGCRASLYKDAISLEGDMQSHSEVLQTAVDCGVGMLWWRQGLVAIADETPLYLDLPQNPATRQAVARVLSLLFGYPEAAVDAPQPTVPAGSRALVIKPVSEWAEDPVERLAWLNSKLEMGAELVLSLHGLDSVSPDQTALLTPANWALALECAGFQVLEQHSAPTDITFTDLEMKAPEFAFRARKISEHLERYPGALYPGRSNRWMSVSELVEYAFPELREQESKVLEAQAL